MLTLEIFADLPAVFPLPVHGKRKAAVPSPERPDADASSPGPSSSLALSRKMTARQTKLQEQHATRLDALRLAGDFHRQLADRYQCRKENCTNHDNYCYLDPLDISKHYSITHVQQEQWARAISQGEATISNPRIKLYQCWLNAGAVTRDSRQPARQTAAQTTQSKLLSIEEQIRESRLQNELQTERERALRRQEQQEERDARRYERERRRQRGPREREREDREERERRRIAREERRGRGGRDPLRAIMIIFG